MKLDAKAEDEGPDEGHGLNGPLTDHEPGRASKPPDGLGGEEPIEVLLDGRPAEGFRWEARGSLVRRFRGRGDTGWRCQLRGGVGTPR